MTLSLHFGWLWSTVYMRKIIYKFLNVSSFDYTDFEVSGKVEIP